MKRIITVLFIIPIILFISCNKDVSPVENNFNENLTAKVSVSPQLAVSGSEFKFKFSALDGSDTISNIGEYQYRLDIGNDGVFEMDWMAVDTFNAVIEQYGEIPIKLETKSPDGQIVSCSTQVKLFEVIKIANIPNSFPGELVWSKDGSNKIAFVWRPTSSGHQIYTVDYPSGAITQVTPDNDTCKHYPEWSPDGTKMAVSYGNKIYIKNLQTGDFSPLIDEANQCKNLSWDPLNKYLFYNHNGGMYKYVFPNKQTTVTPFTFYVCLDPTGKFAADFRYDSLTSNGTFKGAKIVVYDLEAYQIKTEHQIPSGPIYIMDWSIDGYIAFNALSDNEIQLLNVNNGEIMSINANKFERVDKEFAWSPDGSILAFPAKEKGSESTDIYGIKIK
jgi:WD40 repeat protein